MSKDFKYKKGDIVYTPFASFDNGKQVVYEKVTINDNGFNNMFGGNFYSFIHEDGQECLSCPEQFLLSDKDFKFKQLKNGLYVIEGNNEKWFIKYCFTRWFKL